MRSRSFHSAWVTAEGRQGSVGAASSLFPWWSFTKTAIAAAALRLAELGRLELDAALPGKPDTLRQLLQHRAGVPNYGGLRAYHDAVARGDAPWSRERLLGAVGADRLDFEPGTGWAYSNVGYLFVREAIEAAAGLPLGAALEALVLRPAAVSSARLAASPSGFADLFWPAQRGYDPGWVYHGCLIGTPADAATLLHALLGGRILAPGSLRMMLQRHALGGAIPGRPWTASGYGLGLMSGRVGEAGHALGHTGGGPGSTNAVYQFPDLTVPVTVATFTDSEDQGVAEHEALAVARREGR
jgi:CubicO group peptidase (beta-lactamase class C family)